MEVYELSLYSDEAECGHQPKQIKGKKGGLNYRAIKSNLNNSIKCNIN